MWKISLQRSVAMARAEVSTKTEKGEKISWAGTLIDGQPCYELFQRLLHVLIVHCTMQFDIAISDKDQSDLCSSYCVSPEEFLDVSSNIFSSFISLMSHSQKCCKSLKSVCSDFLLKKNFSMWTTLNQKLPFDFRPIFIFTGPLWYPNHFCFKILVITQLFWTCGVELVTCDCL